MLRQLPKDPVFGAVAILTLALAVGANTSIFSVIQTVLLNSLPYRDVHHLMIDLESVSLIHLTLLLCLR